MEPSENDDVGVLFCSVALEKFNALGGVNARPVTHKKCRLLLGRNEFGEITLLLRIDGKPDRPYLLSNFQIFGKFVKEGKATIKLKDIDLQILISNCPPDKLNSFLKTISIKVTCAKNEGNLSEPSVRKKLLAERKPAFKLISPLNAKNAAVVESVIRGSGVKGKKRDLQATPSPGKKSKKACVATSDKENIRVPSRTRKQLSQMLTSPKSVAPKTGPIISPPTKEKILNKFLPSASKLTPSQRRVLDAVRRGQSVFYTGAAGTGKSFLTKSIVGALPPDQTFVTASTAIAACHIGGTTLHAFAGVGSGTQPLEQCVQLANRSSVKQQWKKCRYLIIDEISMVDACFFDKLEAVARSVRGNDKPFGGIVLVLCGDFLQLPPVSKESGLRKKFCFQAASWSSCINLTIELKEIFRQKDARFVEILQQLRFGRCPPEVADVLRQTTRHKLDAEGIIPTRLFTHNQDVDATNQQHLKLLSQKLETFESVDTDETNSKVISLLCPAAPSRIQLCQGAQVMLTKNLSVSSGLVNGARGVVTGFETASGKKLPRVKFASGLETVVKAEKWPVKVTSGNVVFRHQLPLKLAWAISVHKSQGMTLDCVEMSLSRVFESGQVYVALSRAKSLESVRITDFDPSCVRANRDVLDYYKSIRSEPALSLRF